MNEVLVTRASQGLVGVDSSRIAQLNSALKRIFGFKEFKPLQLEIINCALEGKDLLAVLGTGGGKSLCYQLPALLSPGLTIVVTPTISLMNDQVENLNKYKIPALHINSSDSEEDKLKNWKRIKSGEIKLLYISPELLLSKQFLEQMAKITVSRIAVDEAHVVAAWGKTFRPDYLGIPRARQLLGNPPISAFTATATDSHAEEAIKLLGLNQCQRFYGVIDRAEIDLQVKGFEVFHDKIKSLKDLLAYFQANDQPTIVYFTRIVVLEAVANIMIQEGLDLEYYHGKMDANYRVIIEKNFAAGDANILFATKAFGMGIDNPNVRHVIHFEPPENLEEYWQQVGRAGRDGEAADALLMYTQADFQRLKKLVYSSVPELSFIKNCYNILWKWLKEDQQSASQPIMAFNLDRFLNIVCEEDHYKRDKWTAAISILIQFGILTKSRSTLTFLTTKKEIEADDFPITATTIERLRKEQELQLKIIEKYTTTPDLRRFILDHFSSDSIAQSILATSSLESHNLSNEQAKLIVNTTAEAHSTAKTLLNKFSHPAESENQDKASEHMKELFYYDRMMLLEQAVLSGYLSEFELDYRTYYVPTEAGLELLSEERKNKLETRTIKDLTDRIYGPKEKKLLRAALVDWFASEAESVDSTENWRYLVDSFRAEEFRIVGTKKISGSRLAGMFVKKNLNRLDDPEIEYAACKTLLNYLFENIVGETPERIKSWLESEGRL